MVNVLFLDGHVEAMKADQFQEALKKTYEQLGRPMPKESKPADPQLDKPAPVKRNLPGQRYTPPSRKISRPPPDQNHALMISSVLKTKQPPVDLAGGCRLYGHVWL